MGILLKLSRLPAIAWIIGLLATGLSLAFTFGLYPALGDSQHAVLDPDLHGPLGFGLWKLHTFSYYPSHALSAARGPLYPAFVALALAASGGWYPYSVQVAQGVLFGLTCVLAFRTARTLWTPPLAVLAAGLCAIDPFLIWYTCRIWVEPLTTFLFTALMASIVWVKREPSVGRAVLVGVILGLSVLTKSVYSPFLILTPVLLALPFGTRLRPTLAAAVLIAGVAVVAPWTVRNGHLTGIYAPEVGNTGFTLHQGNDFVEDFARAPFSVSALYPISVARMRDEDIDPSPDASEMQKHLQLDAARRQVAIHKMIDSPAFFVKKIVYDAFLFWTFGDSLGKSMVIAALQLPLVAWFCVFLVRRRRDLLQGSVGICAAVIVLFYFAHLPTISLARYSAVLVPAMLIVSVGLFSPRRPDADVAGIARG